MDDSTEMEAPPRTVLDPVPPLTGKALNNAAEEHVLPRDEPKLQKEKNKKELHPPNSTRKKGCRTKQVHELKNNELYLWCSYCFRVVVLGDKSKNVQRTIYEQHVDSTGSRRAVDQNIDQAHIRSTSNWKKMRKHQLECAYENCIKGDYEKEQHAQRSKLYIERFLPLLFKQKKIKYDQTLTKTAADKPDYRYYREELQKRKLQAHAEKAVEEYKAKQKRNKRNWGA